MYWDYLFSRIILNRGRQYFEDGKVKGLTHRGATYQAKVLGTRVYDVEIYLTDRLHPKMFCNCAYDDYCKHEAAVLYAIEEMSEQGSTAGQKEVQVPKIVYPFKHKKNEEKISENAMQYSDYASDRYEYFDMEAMAEPFCFYADELEKAEQLIAQNEITISELQMGYPNRIGANTLMGRVIGVMNGDYLHITFTKDEIEEAGCNIPGCYEGSYGKNYYGVTEDHLCVHELALLLLLEKKLQSDSIGDATDSYASNMMYGFRQRRAGIEEKSETPKKQAVLEPFLEEKGEGLQLGFKVGADKLYVIKKLSEFVDCVENKGQWKLGTKSSLDFALVGFNEKSSQYYTFLKSVVMQEWRRQEFNRSRIWSGYYQYTSAAETIKDRISIYGERLDQFFPLVEGKKIPVTVGEGRRKTKNTEWYFEEGSPDIRLVIEQETDQNQVFQGIRIRGKIPEFLEGINYRYYLEKDIFYRIRVQELEELEPLLRNAEDGEISLQVGRRYLSEFYYRVLPTIEKYAKIKEKNANEIRKFLPPQAEFQFYLDAEDGKILCKAKAVYGENDYDLMAWMNNDQKIDSFRDREMECNILSDVRKIFPEINEEKQSFDSGEDPDAVYQILKSGVADLMHLGEVQSTDRFRRLNIRKNVPVHVGVSIGSELMNLEIHSTELTQEELLDILNSYRKKQKYYRLRNGEFLDLQEDNLQELAEMLDDLHITPKEFVKGKMQLPLYRALYLDKMLEQCEGVYSDRDVRFKKLIKNFKTVEDSEYEVPEKLNQVLRKYQKYGYRWLRTLENCGFGGILADDMGLGKTLQVIAVLLAHKEENRQCHPALIVTPASLVYNWREEFAKYAPELSVGMITGNQTERQKSIEEYEKWDVLVTSYDLLKRDIAEYEGKIFSVQIIDEAQYIKNHTTAAAKSVKLISAHTKYALTGTPIENRLSELWSIFDYLMPGFLYTYDNFKKEMETPITKNQDADATALLKRMVSPFILRRLKGDVLKDLPEKLEENYYAVMEDEQQRLYDGQVIRMKQSLEKESEDNFRKNKLQILAELTRIRQICCDPVLLFDDYQGESAKRNTCLQLIENAIEGDHKVLLFSQFTSMLEILERDLKERQISYYKITGETSKEKRLELVQQFNADKVPVFLISLKAGGTGLNLTGADIVIHYDPWWNVAAQNQATDRAHRIGQTKTVSVYKLIVKNSIEEKILKMQEDKKNLADAVLNGESTNLMDMTKDDLLQLLG